MKTDLATVLTVTTGIMLADDFGKVHALLDHITGDTLFTHQLPRAFEPCRAALLAQYPALSDVAAPTFPDHATAAGKTDIIAAFLEVERAIHGDAFEVAPIAEAVETFGDRLIVVQAP